MTSSAMVMSGKAMAHDATAISIAAKASPRVLETFSGFWEAAGVEDIGSDRPLWNHRATFAAAALSVKR